ncbi:PAS domain S-box protein [Alkalilimnicola ehrlichii]|uniref:histidine kinase n=1 Tax=Alkalilimnicola ehrlichii TaxID=351052 RepID=A0A3E0X385_9GAMM|nr:PAS domain S-box protein [Alkalilimnicola ehrlichii]RFA38926.1 hypothetical protein CAL65_03235 [Alkalilimnicola ehrlichii]
MSFSAADGVAPLAKGDGHFDGEHLLIMPDVKGRKTMPTGPGESDERFRVMANTAPAMLWVTDTEHACTFLSQRWCDYTGQTETQALGFGWLDALHPDDRAQTMRQFEQAAEEQRPFSIDHRIRRADGAYRWALNEGRPRFDEQGRWEGHIGSVVDVHGRKLAAETLRSAAERDAFRVKLTDALRSLDGPAEVQRKAIRIVGEQFRVNRAMYSEAEPDGIHVFIEQDYVAGVASIAGHHRLDDFGVTLMNELRAGRTLAVDDIRAPPTGPPLKEPELKAYEDLGIRAFAAVPLIKEGRLVAYLELNQAEPRTWTAEELMLAEEVAERIWTAVVRARAEVALRDSERRYRTLFNSIQEGFCIAEVLYDTTGTPVDYRFIETNPAFEQHTGLLNAEGKTIRELVPDIEEQWIELYHRIASTEEHIKYELKSEAMGRWFDAEGFRIGDPESHRIALLFSDVTERKAAEDARHERQASVERLNRVYAVLSGINGLIVRAGQRQDLLEEACRIAVDRAGFSLAWTGLLDESGERLSTVRWAAKATDSGSRLVPSPGANLRQWPELNALFHDAAAPIYPPKGEIPRWQEQMPELDWQEYQACIVLQLKLSERKAGCFAYTPAMPRRLTRQRCYY